jgi:tetratricopeptide (TPR) repeat protein
LVYLNLGEPQPAVTHLQEAVKLDPKPPPPLYYNLALAQRALARSKKAGARAEQAAGHLQQAETLSRDAAAHWQQAVDCCNNALHIDPGMTLAQSLLRLLQDDKGLQR